MTIIETTDAEEDQMKTRAQSESTEQLQDHHKDMLYLVDDVPAWYTCSVLGFQQFLTMFSGAVAMPLLVTPLLCMSNDDPSRGYVVGATLFVSGLITLLQSTFGTRLPIIQGPSWAFLPPITAVMKLPEWKCPAPAELELMSEDQRLEVWQLRIREILGAIILASVFQMLLGLSGAVGVLLRFISPITIVATIVVLGIGFFEVLQGMADPYWPVSMTTLCIVVVFSQYLKNVTVPLPFWTPREGSRVVWAPVFKLFPILLSVFVGWTLCAILTFTEVIDKNSAARTDAKINALHGAAWFRVPYPGQWGLPTFSLGAVLGMMAGVVMSVVESIGDYYACARVAGAPPPAVHAINRGIAVEGFGGILCGAFGTANASTSYSGNIGVIGVTKVGSRRVIQWSAVYMILFGVITKFSGLFITIPDPVYGGAFIPIFAMITGMGLSAMHSIQLSSTRNVFILGFSILFAIIIPNYVSHKSEEIKTGYQTFDQIAYVLLSTNMFVAGVLACFLDNTVPGTKTERGITAWAAEHEAWASCGANTYNFPFGISEMTNRWSWTKEVPVCTSFVGFNTNCCQPCPRRRQERDVELTDTATTAC